MASISTDNAGNRRLFFTGRNRKRKILYLGGVPMKTARTIKSHVEELVAAMLAGHSPARETAEWVGRLDDVFYGKLAEKGLVPKRESKPDEPNGIALAAFIDQYIMARKIQKPNTLKNYNATKRALIEFFGQERMLADITPGDCDDWRSHLVGLGLALATIGRTVKRARQFFRAAVRKKIILENPMQDVKAAPQDNKSRGYSVSVEETERIIAACPDAEWRLIVALARYGGLRTPSETFALTWDCVDWTPGRERVRIPSPKTECHAGRETRMMPLFPELRPYLDEVFFSPQADATHVIARHRLGSANLRTPTPADYGPGRGEAVAPAVPEHAGNQGDGTGSTIRVARGDRLDWQFGAHCSQALSPSDGRRFSGGPAARRERRRTRDAESDAATNGRFWQMQARNDASPWNPRACARIFYVVQHPAG